MSSPINVTGTPTLPNIGYYNNDGSVDTDLKNQKFYTYDTLTKNLTTSCKIKDDDPGIYKSDNPLINKYLPKDKDNKYPTDLNIPFYLAKTGVLDNSLSGAVDIACRDNNKTALTNQIKYLTCQLENVRNRVYNSEDFKLNGGDLSIQSIFQKFGNLKIFLIIIFIVTMYLIISGFFGSMDLASNVFSIIEKNSEFTYSYWIGLLLGLALPILILCFIYTKIVCKNLQDLEQYEIYNESVSTEDNPYGIKKSIPSDLKKFDFLTLLLFILLIYAFVAVLFTIKKSAFSNLIYTAIIGTILFIISIFIYIMYAYIPFFNTTDGNQMMKNEARPLRLFIEQQSDVSNIITNQQEDGKVKKAFFMTAVVVFIFASIFFMMKSSNSFVNGLFGSSAILIMPILWVFNFFLAIQYFYIFPIILIVFRFIRYMLMSIIYIISEKSSSIKDSFSDYLVDQLENFKNYSPSWGLLGIDELKLLLNVLGYENDFSKSIISENNDSKNISENKFVSSGLLGFIFQMVANKENTNMNGIIYSIVIMVLTILISAIVLFGVAKVNKK
jgi:hypothetical protein